MYETLEHKKTLNNFFTMFITEYSPSTLFLCVPLAFSFDACLVCVWETIALIKGNSQDKKSEEYCPTLAVVLFSISGLLFEIYQTIIYNSNYFKGYLVQVRGFLKVFFARSIN